jgi:hypothetical protein
MPSSSNVPTATIIPLIQTSTSSSPSFNSGMEVRKIVSLTEVWETVLLMGFIMPIPICSVEYPTSNSPYHPPVVVRMQNVSSTSFEIRLQDPRSFEQSVYPRSVHCLIVERGTWKLPDNRTILAESFTSTVTASRGKWNGTGEDQTAFISPLAGPIVVLGQVMTCNDTGYSTFWSSSSDTNTPASTSSFFAGKQVAKDPQRSRNNEEIGYVVIESGHDTDSAYGIDFEAGVTSASVEGWVQVPSGYQHQYGVPFSTSPEVAVVSMATMNGSGGAWAALAGSPSDSATHLAVSVDENLINGDTNTNRDHNAERIAYCSFESEGRINLEVRR